MQNTIYIWKPIGFTPLELIQEFKEKYPEYKNEIISYAGRLDPMAEGILVLLIGEENKNRENYLNLKKEYESEIVFGISTDTYDSLGMITDYKFKILSIDEIKFELNKFLGKQKQTYPPYSSKAIEGKPLFWWARSEKLSEIKIPEKQIEIYSIELLDLDKIGISEMILNMINQIKNVKGDFRQREIIKEWKKFEKEYFEKELIKIKIRVNCSSGTYIRRVADDLGLRLGNLAFAYSISRIKLGDVRKEDCIKLLN